MLGFIHSWFAPGSNPIGVDFGSDCLRMAQVELVADGEHRLVAAASAEVPVSIRSDATARLSFLSQTVRELLLHGNFRGRRAILSLPASMMEFQLLSVPRMEEDELRRALNASARSTLSFPVDQAVLRHVIAGSSRTTPGHDEVVLMAARREQVDALLKTASAGRLDVIGMNVEPKALIDCFDHIYRRKRDTDVTSCFVDMGCAGTRVMIARGGRLMFGRTLPQGGQQFDQAVADALRISSADARLLRIKACANSFNSKRPLNADRDLANSPPDTSVLSPGPVLLLDDRKVAIESHHQREQVERACDPIVDALIDGLLQCRAYHDTHFPMTPVDRLIFVGGEARHRERCLQIANAMQIEAQVGDPLVRMGRLSDVGIETGIDRRAPQPDWGVAIGLSMGAPLPVQPQLNCTRRSA